MLGGVLGFGVLEVNALRKAVHAGCNSNVSQQQALPELVVLPGKQAVRHDHDSRQPSEPAAANHFEFTGLAVNVEISRDVGEGHAKSGGAQCDVTDDPGVSGVQDFPEMQTETGVARDLCGRLQ